MATPSKKASKIEELLEIIAGRSTAIRADKCLAPPIGCGKEATGFRDRLSVKEYIISGLCQECQDEVFGGGGRIARDELRERLGK